jgi:hypothetical protein
MGSAFITLQTLSIEEQRLEQTGDRPVTVRISGRSQATVIAELVVRLDREMRRVPPVMNSLGLGKLAGVRDPRFSGKLQKPPRPDPTDEAGLNVLRGEPGSFHLDAAPFGTFMDVLNSDPVTAVATLYTLWDMLSGLWSWLVSIGDDENEVEVVEVTDVQAWLEVVKQLGTSAAQHGTKFKAKAHNYRGEEFEIRIG